MAKSALRRVIRVCHRGHETRASVADDFHHFRLAFTHDGRRVLTVATEMLRQPYSLCARAGQELGAAVGLALSPNVLDTVQAIDARQQCTHQFDLAAVAIAAAAAGRPVRYDAVVTDPDGDGFSDATLARDGEEVMAWRVRNYAVESPAPFGGLKLGEGFTNWAASRLEGPQVEAALVLRRAVFISRGRWMQDELNRLGHARGSGGCWVQQPRRATQAIRVTEGVRNFTAEAPPGREDNAWLAFEA